jgi:hypothetical protein
MAAIDSLDAAVENLAAQAPSPLPAILTRQRVRLEQAHLLLREALVASAAGQDESGSLALARSIRQRHPVLPHRSRHAPGDHARTRTIGGVPHPAPEAAGGTTRETAPQTSLARTPVPEQRPGRDGTGP